MLFPTFLSISTSEEKLSNLCRLLICSKYNCLVKTSFQAKVLLNSALVVAGEMYQLRNMVVIRLIWSSFGNLLLLQATLCWWNTTPLFKFPPCYFPQVVLNLILVPCNGYNDYLGILKYKKTIFWADSTSIKLLVGKESLFCILFFEFYF